MNILLNEKEVTLHDGASVEEVRRQFKPQADLCIVNGFPAAADTVLSAGDEVVLIRRGEMPPAEELESLLVARHTPGVHRRLKTATVGIAGLGGLGSSVAVALARSGVGNLVLADCDVVEPSNLNRQQFFIDQIGRPKAEALAENLARINPYVALRARVVELTAGNVTEVFDRVDVLVEAFDGAGAKAMLIAAAMKAMPGLPVVAASGLAGYGAANGIVTRRRARNLYVVGDGVSEARPGAGLMAPRVGVAAHHQANAVIRLLLGLDPAAETARGVQPPEVGGVG